MSTINLNAFFDHLPLQSVPESKKRELMEAFFGELQGRIGGLLTDGMTNEQLDEFGVFADGNSTKAFHWLLKNFPAWALEPEGEALFPEGMPNDLFDCMNDPRICELASQLWLKKNRPEYPIAVQQVTDAMMWEWREHLDEKLALFSAESAVSVPHDPLYIDSEAIIDKLVNYTSSPTLQRLTMSQRQTLIEKLLEVLWARVLHTILKGLTNEQMYVLGRLLEERTLKYFKWMLLDRPDFALLDEINALFPDGFPDNGSLLGNVVRQDVVYSLWGASAHPDFSLIVQKEYDMLLAQFSEDTNGWLRHFKILTEVSKMQRAVLNPEDTRKAITSLLPRILTAQFQTLPSPKKPELPTKPTAPAPHVDIPYAEANNYYVNYGKRVNEHGRIIDEYYDLYPSGGARSATWTGSNSTGHWIPWAPAGRRLSDYHLGSCDAGVITEYTLVKAEDDHGAFGRKARTKAHNAWVENNIARYNREVIDVENARKRQAYQEAKRQYDRQYALYLQAEQQYPFDIATYEQELAQYQQSIAEHERRKMKQLEDAKKLVGWLDKPELADLTILTDMEKGYPDQGRILVLARCTKCDGKGAYIPGSSSVSFAQKSEICPVCNGIGLTANHGITVAPEEVKAYVDEPCEVVGRIQELAGMLASLLGDSDSLLLQTISGFTHKYDPSLRGESGPIEWNTHTYRYLLKSDKNFELWHDDHEEYEYGAPHWSTHDNGTSRKRVEISIDVFLQGFDFSCSVSNTRNNRIETSSYLGDCGWGNATYTRKYKKGYGLLAALEAKLLELSK